MWVFVLRRVFSFLALTSLREKMRALIGSQFLSPSWARKHHRRRAARFLRCCFLLSHRPAAAPRRSRTSSSSPSRRVCYLQWSTLENDESSERGWSVFKSASQDASPQCRWRRARNVSRELLRNIPGEFVAVPSKVTRLGIFQGGIRSGRCALREILNC